MNKLGNYFHYLILVPTAFFTYAMAPVDYFAAGMIAATGVGIWLHAEFHVHE